MSQENGTPELSKIVSVIMEHPELIEQISSLVSSEKGEAEEEAAKPEEVKEEIAVSAPAASILQPAAKQRSRLLYALKPYLSEKRSKAIDSMLTFGEIFDMMKTKG